ncbi:enoyl-CoA hydratase-related protein [Roseovarius sp. EL26]|uniref:enoyl-CoA hydratase-related protein n=1 Tax=Roseovarius sp. EL26 TaxID=2126672 RepID=UPI0013C4A35D|nr:enoyl-CoA hydratase-related protein [Roseovarius sp. EL26]
MVSEVYSELQDGVMVLKLCRPVTNTLSPTLRGQLVQHLESVFHDMAVRAVVICGVGECFSSGLDIQEYMVDLAMPDVTTLCNLIEMSPKPVVMAIHGAALGAGFDLALAGAARVAETGTTIALPEIAFGLIPCAGATQRLPRLIGAQQSLEILSSGRTLDVGDPALAGVFEKITDKEPISDAVQLAIYLSSKGQWRRTRDAVAGFAEPLTYQQAVSTASLRMTKRGDVMDCLLRCVEAAQILPFSQGLALERAAFKDLRNSRSSRALHHLYVAEKRATLAPVLSGSPEMAQTVVCLGDHPQLDALVLLCHSKGADVILLNAEAEQALATHERIKAIYHQAVQTGHLSPQAIEAKLSRLSAGSGYEILQHADIVFDAMSKSPEESLPKLKDRCVWVTIEGWGYAGRSRADRSVTICIPELAGGLRFSEVAAADTDKHALDTVVGLLDGYGRVLLKTTASSGCISGRLQSVFYLAALELVAAGQAPQQVDTAARMAGFALGPFQQIDAIGLPNIARRLEKYQEYHDLPATSGLVLLRSVISDGGFGDWFYNAGQIDPAMVPWLDTWRRHHAHPSAIFSGSDDIAQALHGVLIKEAIDILAEDGVRRASDIDVSAIYALHMARHRGGPLLCANLDGLLPVVRSMQQWMKVVPQLWTPPQILLDMVTNGRCFY